MGSRFSLKVKLTRVILLLILSVIAIWICGLFAHLIMDHYYSISIRNRQLSMDKMISLTYIIKGLYLSEGAQIILFSPPLEESMLTDYFGNRLIFKKRANEYLMISPAADKKLGTMDDLEIPYAEEREGKIVFFPAPLPIAGRSPKQMMVKMQIDSIVQMQIALDKYYADHNRYPDYLDQLTSPMPYYQRTYVPLKRLSLEYVPFDSNKYYLLTYPELKLRSNFSIKKFLALKALKEKIDYALPSCYDATNGTESAGDIILSSTFLELLDSVNEK